MRHDSSPCETLPQLCFAVAVLSPAMLSRRFAGKCVAQLRLRITARDCAMPLPCLSLPCFTAAMPCFALMRLNLPCSYSARLSSAWLRLRFALRDYAIASHISALPLLILAAHRDAMPPLCHNWLCRCHAVLRSAMPPRCREGLRLAVAWRLSSLLHLCLAWFCRTIQNRCGALQSGEGPCRCDTGLNRA